MTRRHITLPEQLDRAVTAQIIAGGYEYACQVLNNALQLVQQQERVYAKKLAAFNAAIQESEDAYARGDYVVVNSLEELDALFDDLETRAAKRKPARRKR